MHFGLINLTILLISLAHIESTSIELWDQTDHNINGFVSSIGTGGTIAGTAEGLKSKNKNITIICADPYGFRNVFMDKGR